MKYARGCGQGKLASSAHACSRLIQKQQDRTLVDTQLVQKSRQVSVGRTNGRVTFLMPSRF